MDNTFLSSLVENPSVATEAMYGDVLSFLKDPDNYLDLSWAKCKYDQNDPLYTDYIRADGRITCSVFKICTELTKVNAYTEALAILDYYLKEMKRIFDEVAKEDQENIRYAIDLIQEKILDTMEQREEYTSNRKATLSRFSDLLKEIHSK